MFERASLNQSLLSFFYLGELAESGKIDNNIDYNYAYECYLIAASQDSA